MALDYNTANCVISVGVTDYDRSLSGIATCSASTSSTS